MVEAPPGASFLTVAPAVAAIRSKGCRNFAVSVPRSHVKFDSTNRNSRRFSPGERAKNISWARRARSRSRTPSSMKLWFAA